MTYEYMNGEYANWFVYGMPVCSFKLCLNCIDMDKLNMVERKMRRLLWTWRSRAYHYWWEFRRSWVQISAQRSVLIRLRFLVFSLTRCTEGLIWYFQLATSASFHIHSGSLFNNHHVIVWYAVWVSEGHCQLNSGELNKCLIFRGFQPWQQI